MAATSRRHAEMTRLFALRMDRGLTIKDVVRATGVSFKTISVYERGLQTRPHAAPLEKLAAFYHVRASDLLDDLRLFAKEREEEREELADAA